jgi:CRP/FNR family transcriptional regulator, anaerobic regulatory protein
MDAFARLLHKLDNYPVALWEPKEIDLKRNDVLHAAGTVNTNIYFVTNGALRIYYETSTGFNTIRFGYANSLFTSLDSFITEKPSVYTVEAIRKASLKVMSKDNFMAFLNAEAENIMLWTAVLSHTIASLLERETDLLAPTPRERYERVLQRSPQLFQQIPHKHIASYLRMAPETLSRLQKS